MCPPLVLGPVVHYLNSLDSLNTSNQRINNIMSGKCKEELPAGAPFLWVDVRDIAKAHVLAMENEAAANKRFFVTAGHFNSQEVTEVIRKNFKEYEKNLPPKDISSGGYPKEGIYQADASRTEKVLGLKYISLEKCVVDTVKSLQAVGA